MLKQDIFDDEKYRALLIMCFYKCPHAIFTYEVDEHMANFTMNQLHETSVTDNQDDDLHADTNFDY